MSRRSQDIPIRPRYGYLDCSNEDKTSNNTQIENNKAMHKNTPASSYSEIPFLAQYVDMLPGGTSYINCDSTENVSNALDDDADSDDNTNSKESTGAVNKAQKRPDSLQCDSTFPYELEGATSSTGEMRHFVAHDLEEKLREGSPKKREEFFENTTPSLSTMPDGALTHRFLQSKSDPVIDGSALSDIEIETQYLATSVDNLMENLGNLLHSISSISADNVEVHKNAVNKLTDSMDANIKCMYTIMAKTEEITNTMRPTEQLGQRIREIKRLVDMLDNTM